MPSPDHLEPDQAVQKWRDQIEENDRLQHVIKDREAQVEELARLNAQALFEARRYCALYNATFDETHALRARCELLAGSISALSIVAEQSANSLFQTIDLARAAAAEPTPKPEPEKLPDLAPAPADDPIDPPPLFLQDGHKTPLPDLVTP